VNHLPSTSKVNTVLSPTSHPNPHCLGPKVNHGSKNFQPKKILACCAPFFWRSE